MFLMENEEKKVDLKFYDGKVVAEIIS